MCWWDVVFTCGQAETRAKDQSSEQIVAMVLCSALFASAYHWLCFVPSRYRQILRRSARPSEVMVRVAMAMARLYVTFVELTSVLTAWEMRDNVRAGAVITFLAILTATVVRFARHIVNHRQVPAVPTFLKSGTPFPIIPAFLPAAGRVRALGNIFFGDFSVVWMGKLFWSADITFCPLQAAPHFI